MINTTCMHTIIIIQQNLMFPGIFSLDLESFFVAFSVVTNNIEPLSTSGCISNLQ